MQMNSLQRSIFPGPVAGISNQRHANLTHPSQELAPQEKKTVPTLSVSAEDTHYGNKLSPEARQHISELKMNEMKVKAHEQAHQSVGGSFAGGISYDTEKGPDGQQYIVGGEVPISMPSTDDPEETIRAMEQIRRAALAPANPSSQDMQVATKASQAILQARSELEDKLAQTLDPAVQVPKSQKVHEEYQRNMHMLRPHETESIYHYST
ncbi:putative metalloprotease CJM1_0395 family protein [Pontibacillus salicampi]